MVARIAQRAERIAAFEVMDVVQAARRRDTAGTQPPTCHLEVGQPGAPPPAAALDAARAALDGPLGYTDALGTEALRHAIAGYHRRAGGLAPGIEVDPAQVAVTTGASAGCLLVFLASFDPGDRVGVVEPGYPCYANILTAVGVEPVVLHVDSSTGYQPTAAHLHDAGDLAGVVVASPANPTGAVLDAALLDELAGWCDTAGATLVVDEIYHGIADGPLPSAAGRPGAVVVQSFSKYFCMTGWRLGWLVLPHELVRPVERLAQNLYLAPPTTSQAAALAALGATDELDTLARRHGTNRELLVATLERAGVRDIAPARGAFYVWADLSAWGDSPTLCRRWLDEIGVAATPGTDFDATSGDRYVRFSVAAETEEITEAARRLGEWLGSTAPATGGPA